jgi:hypothetical protein
LPVFTAGAKTKATLPEKIIVVYRPKNAEGYAVDSTNFTYNGTKYDETSEESENFRFYSNDMAYLTLSGQPAFLTLTGNFGPGEYKISGSFKQIFDTTSNSSKTYKFSADTSVSGGQILFSKNGVDDASEVATAPDGSVNVYIIPEEGYHITSIGVKCPGEDEFHTFQYWSDDDSEDSEDIHSFINNFTGSAIYSIDNDVFLRMLSEIPESYDISKGATWVFSADFEKDVYVDYDEDEDGAFLEANADEQWAVYVWNEDELAAALENTAVKEVHLATNIETKKTNYVGRSDIILDGHDLTFAGTPKG